MSEKTDLSHYIPRRLDDGAKFLFWEMDVAMIGLMGVLVGIGSGFPVIGLFEVGWKKWTPSVRMFLQEA